MILYNNGCKHIPPQPDTGGPLKPRQMISYDGIPLFDVRETQPQIDLHEIRFDSSTSVRSMVTSVHFKNVFKVSVTIFLVALRAHKPYFTAVRLTAAKIKLLGLWSRVFFKAAKTICLYWHIIR